MQQRYMFYAWGVNADTLTPVPMPTQTDNTVSYQQGFGPDYELDLTSDPAAIAIQRQKSNAFFNDVTLNIQNYQQYGTPEFIDSTDNQGAVFGYDANALVRYSPSGVSPFGLFVSLVANNTQLPGTAGFWSTLINQVTGDARYANVNGNAAHLFSAMTAPAADNSNLAANTSWIRTQMQSLVAGVISAVATVAGFSFNPTITSGHFALPSWLGGFIINWGINSISSPGAGSTIALFDVDMPYPNINLFCIAGYAGNAPGALFGAICGNPVSTTQVEVTIFTSGPTSGAGGAITFLSFGR